MTATPVVVLGAGGTAADVLEFLALPGATHAYACVAVLDDNPALHGRSMAGATVEGPLSEIHRWPDAAVIDTLGSPRSFRQRPEIIDSLPVSAERYATVIHPGATVSPAASLGRGCIIYPHTRIGPGATLGEHVIVLSHSVVNHDAGVGDFSILASQVALGGRAQLGRCCYAGMGSSVIQDGIVGDGALLGMGSVVLQDVPPGLVVGGNPAVPLVPRQAGDPG